MKRTSALISLMIALALVNGFSRIRAQENTRAVDLREYYPLSDGNTWTYQYKSFQADGQVFYRLTTRTVSGEIKLGEKDSAKKLIDDQGTYYLVSVDSQRLRFYGENEGQGEVRYTPPYTFVDVSYLPGKSYSQPHVLSQGEPVYSEVTYYGIESTHVPAGSFKDCLKVRFQYTKPSGASFTITSYLAKGVGVVKEIYEIFSPVAEQTLRSEIELLHGTVNRQRIGGEAAQTVKVAEYFPYHQGDSWTYDWTYRLANGQTRTTVRKRWFEGTKFTNAGAAFKLVSDSSEDDYQFYLLDRRGLRITESGERGLRAQGVKFYFDPALLLASDDMVIGRTYRWSQREADGKSIMHFRSQLEGFEAVETPMGRFDNCLRLRIGWDTSSSRVENVYWYARGVGIVAYDYEAVTKKDNIVQIALAARLKEATIGGRRVATAEEAKALWDKLAAELAAAEDNPTARTLFREASLNRYVWDAEFGFRGFTADMVMRINGGEPITVKVKCLANLDIEIDHPDPTIKAIAHEEMSQFVTHRQPRKPFDDWYGPDKAKFKLGKQLPIGQEILVEGDAMGSRYVVGEKMVKQLSRNIGRLEFTINNKKHIAVEDGRYIATDYEVSYYTADTKQEVGRDSFTDAYVKQGPYWVPTRRVHLSTVKGKPARVELEIKRLEYLQ